MLSWPLQIAINLFSLFIFNNYSLNRAQRFTGMATVALISVDWRCLAIHQFIDLTRTAFHTFTTAVAFFFVNSDIPHIHHPFLKSKQLRTSGKKGSDLLLIFPG
jgi:hypothetical protein